MQRRAISTTHTAVLLAGLAACSTGIAPAAAQDSSWPKWPGSAYASNNDPVDRAFVKEWEATPPKGFPTLSPANIGRDQGGHRALHAPSSRTADGGRCPT